MMCSLHSLLYLACFLFSHLAIFDLLSLIDFSQPYHSELHLSTSIWQDLWQWGTSCLDLRVDVWVYECWDYKFSLLSYCFEIIVLGSGTWWVNYLAGTQTLAWVIDAFMLFVICVKFHLHLFWKLAGNEDSVAMSSKEKHSLTPDTNL